jgi:asparagine synthase (glutamine-hydrolysing)
MRRIVCGIAGRFNHRSGAPADEAELVEMARRLAHRGPDGEGTHLDGAVGLAHRRLSIIDREGGAQPMATSGPELVVTFNGEIYNYVELSRELRAKGHVFHSRSDTEVLLRAYAEWGLDCVSHFNGMFAFALWDPARRRLVLGRDRLGVKPLFYAETRDGVVFASEMKALVGVPTLDLSLHLGALAEYLMLGYVVNPRSMISGIQKLGAGELRVYQAGREPSTHKYWRHRFEPDERRGAAETQHRLRELFDDSVKLRLRSDVPVGVLLSGGVDSTAIASTVAAVRAEGLDGIATFCVGVDVPGAETEFEPARKVAAALGTEHHELRLDVETHSALLLEASSLLDEPLAEPMIGQLLGVCRLAREHGPVLLSGEGADETWLGYTPYRTMYALGLAQHVVPGSAARAAAAWAGTSTHPFARRLRRYAALLPERLEDRYLGLNDFDGDVKVRLLSDDVQRALVGRDPYASLRALYDDTRGLHPIARMAAVDSRAWLVDNSLARSDIMSMAASVEVRLPFMDYRLVELAERTQVGQRIGPTDQKIALKRALADRIPAEVRKRRKVGFPTPLPELFRGPWGSSAREVLENPSPWTEPLFDRKLITTMLDQQRTGAADWSRTLFQLLVLEHWSRATSDASRPRGWRVSPSVAPAPLG